MITSMPSKTGSESLTPASGFHFWQHTLNDNIVAKGILVIKKKIYSLSHAFPHVVELNTLPDMPILGSSNSAANKGMMSKI